MSGELSLDTLQGLIAREYQRQEKVIQLIASENLPSPAVHAVLKQPLLAFKTAEGAPGARFHAGCSVVDEIERLAQQAGKKLFDAHYVNVQPVTASVANLAATQAILMTQPQPRVLAMDLACGGHISHRQFDEVYFYGVDRSTGRLDYDAIGDLARRVAPTVIIAGSSAYPRQIDFQQMHRIAERCGAVLLADIAHLAGLVAAGLHPSPMPWAQVTTASTYKTLRGPRSGVILAGEHADRTYSGESLAHRLDRALFPGLQSSPNLSTIAAKAACFIESATPAFATYARGVVANSQALASALAAAGVPVLTGGTDTHIVLVDVSPYGLTGALAEAALESVGIQANRNLIPYDTRPARIASGVRFGTSFATSRGLGSEEMSVLAAAVARIWEATRVATDGSFLVDQTVARRVNQLVSDITARYPLFDSTAWQDQSEWPLPQVSAVG